MPKTLLLAVALVAAASSASGAVLYSTGFEAPTYTAGASVGGVDGWVLGSGAGASQTVSATRSAAGTQSLFFDNSGTNNSFYSVYHPLGAFSGPITLSLQLYVPSTNNASRLAEMEFSTGTLGGGVLGLSLDGAGNIRSGTTWSALYGTTIAATAPAGSFADRWLTVTLTYATGTNASSVAISGFGGGFSYTGTFTATTAPTNFNLGTDYLGTTLVTGQTYYDSVVLSTAVPEPGTMMMLGVAGGGALLLRRRFQSSRSGK